MKIYACITMSCNDRSDFAVLNFVFMRQLQGSTFRYTAELFQINSIGARFKKSGE